MTDPTTRWRARLNEGRLCDAMASVGVLASGAILVAFSNGLYFVGDSWDFLLHRGTIDGVDRGLLAPHNEHWSTVPILVFRAMVAVFGLNHFLPYLVLMVITHMVLCALVYVVLNSLGCARWPALLATLVLAFFGGGYENTMWEFQISFVAPLAFGMGAIAVLHRWPANVLGYVTINALLILGLMSCSTGIGAVVLVTTYAAFTHGVRAAVAVAAAPTLVYLSWYALYGGGSHTPVTDLWTLLDVPAYVWTGMTAGLERATGVPSSGGPLLIVLIVAPFVVRDITPHLRALACAGVVTAVLQMLLAGIARVDLGVAQADSSRYAYLILVLLSPAIAVALTALFRRVSAPHRLQVVTIALLGAMYVVHGMAAQHAFREIRLASPDLERLMSGIQAVVPAGGPVLTEAPFPPYNLDVTASVLDTRQARALLSDDPVSSRTMLDGESMVYVGVRTSSFGLDPAVAIEVVPELSSTGEGPGVCRTLVAPVGGVTLVFPSSAAGEEITVTSPSTQVTTRLERDGLRSLETAHPITADIPVVVAARASGAKLHAAFNGSGNYSVCAGSGSV